MKLPRHWVQLLVTVSVLIVAMLLLWNELKDYNAQDVLRSLRNISPVNIWLALGFAALNYVILIGYEYLAIRAIGHPLEVKRIAIGSFVGFAVSLNFGALLGGTPIRIRMYASWGLTAIEIAKLMAMLAITFWVGALALAGVVFIYDPMPIPPELHLPFESVRPLGLGLLAVVACYVSLSVVRTAPFVFRDYKFTLPSLRLTLSQIFIASLDQVVAAAVMYALIRGSTSISFTEFLGIYLLTVVAVLITHVPGGVGILELIMLKLIPSPEPERIAAALIIFRVVYYLLPLLLAALLFVANEALNFFVRRRK